MLFEHRPLGFVGGDHVGVALPAAFLDFVDRDGDAGVDLVVVEAGRERRVGEIDGFGLLTDEQDAGHGVAPHGLADVEERAGVALRWVRRNVPMLSVASREARSKARFAGKTCTISVQT